MKVYLVNAWDSCYPSWDNTLAVFYSWSDANDFSRTCNSEFENIEIAEKEVIHESNSN